MTDGTEEYSPGDAEGEKIKHEKAKIERADIFGSYLKRYGKNSLKWAGYPKDSLIIQMRPLSSQDSRTIYFDYSETIPRILEHFKVKHPKNLEGKMADYLIQSDTIAGFKAPLRRSYFVPRSQPKQNTC